MLISNCEVEPRRRRSLIRPLPNAPNPSANIFAPSKWNPEQSSPTQPHHVVGEGEWKRSTYGRLFPKQQVIVMREGSEQSVALKNSIPESSIGKLSSQASMNNTRGSKFCLDQIDKDTREQRVLDKHSQTQTFWKGVEQGLLAKVKRNKSISYNAVKNIYLHPNPDKIALVNDNVPQYWQHSLRDNCKTLYRHLRNNPFKKEVAEEMLQTLAGRKKLEDSIPTLQTIANDFSLKGKNTRIRSMVSNPVRLKMDETYIADYAYKEKWLSEISYTQTKSTSFGLTPA